MSPVSFGKTAYLMLSEAMHDWLEFLKNAQTWRNMPRAVTNPAVREALRMARFDSLSPAESKTMNARQMYRADQRNMLRYARTEGMQQGIQQGMQQGAQLASLDIATVLLGRGMPVEEVAEATSLPLATVKKLTAGKKPGASKRTRAAKAR